MPRRDLTFRVFVSSTFSDLIAERNALQEHVFPWLREYCRQRGARFQAIDLRWGVSEEAALDQQTMTICLQELKRCQNVSPRPNFIVLLGERYGWRPLPPRIPAVEFEEILNHISPGEVARLRWNEDQLTHSKGWYRRDDNADPPEYSLLPRSERFVDPKIWAEEEAELRDLLLKGVERVPPAVIKDRQLYFDSAAHQEIRRGALEADDPRGHVFCYFRRIVGLPKDESAREYRDIRKGSVDEEAGLRLRTLKTDLKLLLPGEHIHDRYEAQWCGDHPEWGLRELCTDVKHDLRRIIDMELQAFEQQSELMREVESHRDFAFERSRRFIGRSEILERIRKYLNDPIDNRPLVIHGSSGSGKTALMAHAWLTLTDPSRSVGRFIGATPSSSELRTLLESILLQLGMESPPTEIVEIKAAFRKRLSWVSSGKDGTGSATPLFVFLDGLDQLYPADEAPLLRSWLPREFGPNVKIVVSVLEAAGTAGSCFEEARSTWPESMVELTPLDYTRGEELLNAWLRDAGRRLTIEQKSGILQGFIKDGRPLYLKVAFGQARRWKHWERGAELGDDVSEVIMKMLARLEQPEQHGRPLVERALSDIAAARHGLTEDELLDILSGDSEVMNSFHTQSPTEREKKPEDRIRHLPVVIWSRLYAELEPYLTQRLADGAVVMNFFHRRQVAEVVSTRYFGEDGRNRSAAHGRLAAYFQHLACPDIRGEWGQSPLRALSELPYQRLQAGQQRHAEHLLCDLGFLQASIDHGLLDQVAEDLRSACEKAGLPSIRAVEESMVESMSAIRQRLQLAMQTIVNRLRHKELGRVPKARLKKAETLLDECGTWLCAETPLGTSKSVEGILFIAPERGVFYSLGKDSVDERNLVTQRLVDKHDLPVGHAPLQIAVHPITGQIVWVDSRGMVGLESLRTPMRLRTRMPCLAFLGKGIVGIDPQGRLVYWELSKATPVVLNMTACPAFTGIAVTPNAQCAVILAGDRLPAQRILLLKAGEGQPQSSKWPVGDSVISAASLDDTGRLLLLATRSRQLRLWDINTRRLMAEISCRMAGATPVRGVVEHIRLTTHDNRHYAILATSEGELCVWDVSSDGIRMRGSYRGLRQQARLCAIEALPGKGEFVVATDRQMEMMSLEGEEPLVLTTPITQCSLSGDGWFVTATNSGNCVSWFKDGRHRGDFVLPNNEPTSLAAFGPEGAVCVGYRRGTVARLLPGEEIGEEDAVDLFDRPVVSVVALDNSRILAACENGQARVVKFQPVAVLRDIKPVGNVRREQFVRRLDEDDAFVSCGRFEAGDSRTSVIVVRADDTKDFVFETGGIVHDLVTAENGATLYAVLNEKISCYRHMRGRWVLDGERPANATHTTHCCRDLLAVVLQDRGLRWLELWSTGDSFRTVAAMELPLECTSISSSGHSIAVGAVDGRHCLVSIRGMKGDKP